MHIRLRNRNLRYRRLGKYLGRLFFSMWRNSRPQPPDREESAALLATQKIAVYAPAATSSRIPLRESHAVCEDRINRMFRRLDSNQNNRDQNPAGCQLPYAGLMEQIEYYGQVTVNDTEY
jgi:hypothetical protein